MGKREAASRPTIAIEMEEREWRRVKSSIGGGGGVYFYSNRAPMAVAAAAAAGAVVAAAGAVVAAAVAAVVATWAMQAEYEQPTQWWAQNEWSLTTTSQWPLTTTATASGGHSHQKPERKTTSR